MKSLIIDGSKNYKISELFVSKVLNAESYNPFKSNSQNVNLNSRSEDDSPDIEEVNVSNNSKMLAINSDGASSDGL